jgi:hypothetical protein
MHFDILHFTFEIQYFLSLSSVIYIAWETNL